MVKSNLVKGSLIFVPKVPLALWSKLGDPDFWDIGLILKRKSDGVLTVYSCEGVDSIHLRHVREVHVQ